MYIKREIEKKLKKAKKCFPALLISGARQSGKSTLTKKLFKDATYITLDDALNRKAIKEDPKLFL